MKKSRYTLAQAPFGPRRAEESSPVSEVYREMGISEQTCYRWKKKFQGMGVAEVRRLRVLEEENRKLRQPVPDLSLEKQMLQHALRKNPEACSAADLAPGQPPLPERGRRAGFSENPDHGTGPGLGELRIPAPLRPAAKGGLGSDHKRVYRLYRQESVMLRDKKPNRPVSCRKRTERPVAAGVDESWSWIS